MTGPPHISRLALPTPRSARRWRARRFVLTTAGLAVSALFLAPYAVMLLDSLRPSGEVLQTPPGLLPGHWQVTAYSNILGDTRFLHWLNTSLIIAFASTAIVLVAAIPAAYFTARYRFPGRRTFLFMVLITQMFAPTSLVVGLYREFFEANLINTYLAIVITNAAFNLAFAVWIMHGFFASLPKEVEEAAALDGCGRARTLLQIMLPLTLPGVVTATIFTFIAAWNEYVVALTLMQDDYKKPLTVGISSYVTGYDQIWNELFAASVIAIVPVVVLFAVIERHLVGGLTAGSIK